MILQDRPFADQIVEVLDINFLELHYLRVFVKKVFDYREKYDVHPTYKTMISIVRADIEDENAATQQQLRNYFARIHNTQVSGSEYVKSIALDFCRKQKLKEAMIKSVSLLQKSSFDEIAKIINDAIKLGDVTDFGYDYLKDFEKRFELKSRNPITTGWQEIDQICQGGLGIGELGVIIAPTGAGKSMVLVHLGTLIIKEYPTKSASTRTIRNHLEKLRMRDVSPDVVIVDYGDLLRPISSKSEKRHELESIYEEMRGLAKEFNCCIWTASQTNRSGLNAEVVTMESIGEAFNKCFVSDFIFSLSRTVEDKQNNTGRFFVAKNRNGPDGIVYPISMTTANVQIKVLDPSQEDQSILSTKDQSEVLKQKYKKFRQSKKEGNGE